MSSLSEAYEIIEYLTEIDYNSAWITAFEGKIFIDLNMNDVFYFATGDCESITNREDLELFKKAVEDCKNAVGHDIHADVLYAARKRKLVPINLGTYPQDIKKLFYNVLDIEAY